MTQQEKGDKKMFVLDGVVVVQNMKHLLQNNQAPTLGLELTHIRGAFEDLPCFVGRRVLVSIQRLD